MDMLKISHVSKRFGDKEVLQDLDFTVPKHTVYGFVGQNVPRYEQETGSLFRHLQLWRELYT